MSTLDLRSEAARRSNSRIRAKQTIHGHSTRSLDANRPAWRPSSANAPLQPSTALSTPSGIRRSLRAASPKPRHRQQSGGYETPIHAHPDAAGGEQAAVTRALRSSREALTNSRPQTTHGGSQALKARITHLEKQLCTAVRDLSRCAQNGSMDRSPNIFNVQIGEGMLGMVVTLDQDKQVVITELKSDMDTGDPLLALASGQLKPGDIVVALNGQPLGLLQDLHQISHSFRQAARPLTMLIKRVHLSHVQL